MGALTSASATSLAPLVAGREVTAREAVEAHLRRIEAVDGKVNAVVQLDAERALSRAEAADRAVAGATTWRSRPHSGWSGSWERGRRLRSEAPNGVR
ncbi:MAG: hypothetical protein QOH46_4139 [Solirubrobacteraceae bacterium]|jgi:Asp-tRNA(Asn)/Glu-tRNA(Gln) amidotransferase A subunit family amidase|nr:hypothetical protein [Solirubrobacteraceae bacterium]